MFNLIRFAILFVVIMLSFEARSQEIKDITAFFKEADLFFKNYAVEGNIKYAQLKRHPSTLQPLIDFIGKTPLKDLDTYKKKAYLINCYNLLVIGSVVNKYPIPTVQDTDGFFKKIQHNVGGKMMTLDHLEYKIIFKEYQDARLHFVLVCAAKGCPPIPNFAYTPGELTFQINAQCQLALDNPNFLYLDNDKSTVKLSPIFDWYKDDFAPSIQEFINAHRSEKLPEAYELAYYEYDWKLNMWEEE